jgi:hypothetical protein
MFSIREWCMWAQEVLWFVRELCALVYKELIMVVHEKQSRDLAIDPETPTSTGIP